MWKRPTIVGAIQIITGIRISSIANPDLIIRYVLDILSGGIMYGQ
jgi:hypothetical protein